MKIRTVLILGGVLAVALVLAVGGVFLAANRATDRALALSMVTSEVRQANSQLVLLTFEYVTRGSERAREQWKARHESQGKLIDEIAPSGGDVADLLDRVAADHALLGTLFEEIVEARDASQASGPVDAAALQAREYRLTSQFMVTVNDMIAASVRLDRHVQDEFVRAQERGTSATFAAVSGVAALLAVLFVLMGRRLLRPLHHIQDGVRRVGGGDLDHTIGLASRDEVGELARAFDRMMADLRDVTVSRDELEEQIAWRTRVEDELRAQTAELARSNAELEQFAYVASHDLQEPLRMVVSYLQILEKRYKGRLDADADDFIGFAVDGAGRMQAMIEDLLLLSRVGTRGGEPKPVESAAALTAALDNLRMKIEETGADVRADGELPTVTADPRQLVLLFQNLISNALKFRGPERPRVRVSATRDGTHWVFAVRDNGIGIDAQYADRIFGLFQRLHGRDEYPGTGIGLSVCKKIVERHGGRIWVEGGEHDGAAHDGASFFFTLRAVDADTY